MRLFVNSRSRPAGEVEESDESSDDDDDEEDVEEEEEAADEMAPPVGGGGRGKRRAAAAGDDRYGDDAGSDAETGEAARRGITYDVSTCALNSSQGHCSRFFILVCSSFVRCVLIGSF